MRTAMLCSILSTALLAGTACKNNADREAVRDDDRTERVEPPGAVIEPNRDVERDQTTFSEEARQRMDRLEARIAELEAKGDAQSRETADRLRERRTELSARLENLGDRVDAGWEAFKRDTSRTFDELEADLDRAL